MSCLFGLVRSLGAHCGWSGFDRPLGLCFFFMFPLIKPESSRPLRLALVGKYVTSGYLFFFFGTDRH